MGTITAFTQDYKGYIWIATAEGLHRYDGKSFKIFKHNEGNDNSLSDSYITSLATKDNNIYIGTNLGTIDILDADNYTFSHIVLNAQDESYDYPIEQLLLYKDRLLIDTDGGGLWEYFYREKKIRRVQVAKLGDTEIEEMMVHNDSLYLLTKNTLISTNLHKANVVYHTTEKHSFNTLCSYGQDILIGSKNGLFLLSDISRLRPIELPPRKRYVKQINKLLQDGKNVWIASDGGLMLLEKDMTVRLYRSNQLRPYSLINDKVNHLFVDRDNIVWVGTRSGVSKYAPQLSKFDLLQYFDLDGITYGNNVYFTYEDQDASIWLGTLGSGLVKLDANNNIENIYPKLGTGNSESESVRSILQDTKGTYWIGTPLEGLFIFNPKTGHNKRVASVQQGNLNNNTIRSIFEDKHGTIWLGTNIGLSGKDSNSNQFAHYQADKLHKNNSIYQIIEHPTEDKLIIASFRGGLQLFDLKTKRFEILKHNAEDSSSISNNNLMCFEWVNDDTLLIGTYGGGLNIYDLHTKSFSSVSEVDGLVNNIVYGMLYDGNGSVWLSTNDGLVNYHLYKKTYTNFKPVHYLQSTEFNEGAFLKSSTGTFYFGGVNGLNSFDPNKILFDTAARNVMLTDLRGAFTQKAENSVTLGFLKSRLEIDFIALYYANPSGVAYRYQLRGLDEDWVAAKTSNTAVYPILAPGNYTFMVEAHDEFGNWSGISNPLKITVMPPIWQRWWFILLTVAALAGLIYALFRYRTREIKRSYKLQLINSELTALRSQMNPHFIFNSLNSIQYFILKKEPREAYTYLSKFASLMRKILQNSRLKYISVADEIEGLDLYLEMEKMRMDNNLDYTIKTKNIEDLKMTNMPTMLIQPFVENSIIHGLLSKEDNRKLDVLISKENQHLLCTITDNGIGREAARIMNARRSTAHNSTGMSLTQKRLEILSEGKGNYAVIIKDLQYEDGTKGTEVELVVPIISQID
jgi:ligand-binding sensor domain-containing protein|tara:strand:- start:2050 stop:4953 length:2904 start_codon:yes stop_codon:yes gene_type:complete